MGIGTMIFRFAACSVLAVLSVAICLPLISPAAAKTGTSQPLFEQDAPLEMEFEVDFAKVCHDPTSGRCEDLPATIQYIDDRGVPISLDVKLRTRGRWRRDSSNCDLPALFVYFDPTQVEGTLFENQTMLPFTTHCRSYNRIYHRYTMREYLAYRYYNLLTDNSLQARLTHTKFRDTGGSFRSRRYGFFTEHFQRAASRMGAEFIEREDPRHRKYFWLTGHFQNSEPKATDTDEYALGKRYVSVVPCQIDATNTPYYNQLKTNQDELQVQ